MIVLDVLYVAIATLGVMIALHAVYFVVLRLLYPPEPIVIYRDVPAVQQAPLAPLAQFQQAPLAGPPPPILTQPDKEDQVQLPEYDIRTTSARLDPVLPEGIQETRPPGL